MDCKWIGAVLIILGCGGFGLALCAQHRAEETSLLRLIRAMDYMACELQFRLTPLPELCRMAGQESSGQVGKVLVSLGMELDSGLDSEVSPALERVLTDFPDLPVRTRSNLNLLGSSLGRFDLEGQKLGLDSVRTACRRDLEELNRNRENRLRSYQTLALCTGAALAILLI
jgi:stage III sporulation protein AB